MATYSAAMLTCRRVNTELVNKQTYGPQCPLLLLEPECPLDLSRTQQLTSSLISCNKSVLMYPSSRVFQLLASYSDQVMLASPQKYLYASISLFPTALLRYNCQKLCIIKGCMLCFNMCIYCEINVTVKLSNILYLSLSYHLLCVVRAQYLPS